MSAGAFDVTNYELDNGDIQPIRVQPETLALTIEGTANAAPTGAQTNGNLVRVSGGRRRIGIKARSVRVKFTAAPPAGGYLAGQIISLPILTKTLYDLIPNAGGTGTYLGVAIRVVGKSSQAGR